MKTQASASPPRWISPSPARITGLEIVSPLGSSREDHWAAVLAGAHGLAATRSFDSARLGNPISGEIQNLPVDQLPSRLIPATDRMTKISLIAAEGAIRDSGLDPSNINEDGIGVVTAATAGGYSFGQNELQALWAKGPKHVSTHQSYAWFYAVNTGQISIRHGFKGHSGVVVADDAGGLDALAAAQRRLGRGNHTVLAGSVDSAMCPWGRVAQTSTGLTSAAIDVKEAYLPFDRRAGGWVHGEGGAHFVFESSPNGKYGAIGGHGATMAQPTQAPGEALAKAISLALAQANLSATQIDVVFADAAGVRDRDLCEAAAIAQVFGRGSVPVTAPKVATGRMGCGSGPVDVAMALLSLRDQVIPPTINVDPDPSLGLRLVTKTQSATLTNALILSRGIGGFTSALIVHS